MTPTSLATKSSEGAQSSIEAMILSLPSTKEVNPVHKKEYIYVIHIRVVDIMNSKQGMLTRNNVSRDCRRFFGRYSSRGASSGLF